MQDPLANPFWHALRTEQSTLALGDAFARRFPADVIPFGGLAANDERCLQALHDLLPPGGSVYVLSETPLLHPGLRETERIPGIQMIHQSGLPTPPGPGEAAPPIRQIQTADHPAMLRLKAVAFPGYFGPRAATLGTFYGIHQGGELVAMAGERLALPGFREISAVCTHPGHTGKGYAAMLIRRLLQQHAQAGLRSILHAAANNTRALTLYERLGFTYTRTLTFRRIQRIGGIAAPMSMHS